MFAGLRRLRHQRNHPPAATTESFAGKTVLVTGTTSGLGFEAAKKLAALNASKLIITARTASRGEAAKNAILSQLSSTSKTEILVLELNMSSSESVKSFSRELASRVPVLDAAILNAGTIQAAHRTSADGFEEAIQVNVISTILLGLLILPLLLASAERKNEAAHLTFVSSGTGIRIAPKSMEKFMKEAQPVAAMSELEDFPGGQKQYARSKLLLEYSMRHLSFLPSIISATTHSPKVIVNSCCPGMVKSELGRQYQTNIFVKLLMQIFYRLFTREPRDGSNIYISALTRGPESQGQLWKEDRFYEPGEMIESVEGERFGGRVWTEVEEFVRDVAPETRRFL